MVGAKAENVKKAKPQGGWVMSEAGQGRRGAYPRGRGPDTSGVQGEKELLIWGSEVGVMGEPGMNWTAGHLGTIIIVSAYNLFCLSINANLQDLLPDNSDGETGVLSRDCWGIGHLLALPLHKFITCGSQWQCLPVLTGYIRNTFTETYNMF